MFQEVKRKTSQWFHPKGLAEKRLRWKLNLFITIASLEEVGSVVPM